MEENRALKKYREWLGVRGLDTDVRQELIRMISDLDKVEEQFDTDLEFGTAGLRAVMGAGTARMNIYTVAAAAIGVAETIKSNGLEANGIMISYDSRNNSKKFAEITARVLAFKGVQVFLSDAIRAVPILSFAIRFAGAAGGVMITASHNPAKYNGFKVFMEDGGQIVSSYAKSVQRHIPDMNNVFEIVKNLRPLDEYVSEDRIMYFGEEVDRSYLDMIRNSINSDMLSDEDKSNFKIAYSPLNGTGLKPFTESLNENGFSNVYIVEKQRRPNGNFPTLRVPNPEARDTYDEVIALASQEEADIAILTDPDADRLGVAVRNSEGEYQVLTGNQIGMLLMEYILSTKEALGTLEKDSFCSVSIVTGRLARGIASRYGIMLYETPTGSKHIAGLIRDLDDNGDKHFQMGFEEGNGYMIGTDCRDKDSIMSAMQIIEMACRSKTVGNTLIDELNAIYTLYGYAAEKSFSIEREGLSGAKQIADCMAHYRSLDGKLGEGIEVSSCHDYMPDHNLLVYELGKMDWIAIRPSGTEPKLKVYFGFYGDKKSAEEKLNRISKVLMNDIDSNF